MGSTFATTADTIKKRPGERKGKRNRGKIQQGQSEGKQNLGIVP